MSKEALPETLITGGNGELSPEQASFSSEYPDKMNGHRTLSSPNGNTASIIYEPYPFELRDERFANYERRIAEQRQKWEEEAEQRKLEMLNRVNGTTPNKD